MSAEGKGDDEIYCTTCGAVIKRRAELCPECGVRNEYAPVNQPGGGGGRGGRGGRDVGHGGGHSQRGGGRGGAPGDGGAADGALPAFHDPTAYETTASAKWRYVVYAGVGIWAFAILVAAVTVDVAIGIGALSILLVPVGVYFDAKWVRANYPYDPSAGALALVSFLFGLFTYGVLASFVALVYLYYRRKARKRAAAMDLA